MAIMLHLMRVNSERGVRAECLTPTYKNVDVAVWLKIVI